MTQGYNFAPLMAGLESVRQQRNQNALMDFRQEQAQIAQANQDRRFGLEQKRFGLAETAQREALRRQKEMDPLNMDLLRARTQLAQTKARQARTGQDPLAPFNARAQAAARFGIAPNTPEFKEFALTGKLPKAAGGQYKDFNERVGVENSIRKEFSGLTKAYRDTVAAYQRIASTEPTAAGDMALIFNYMKMLDPGSTVREGEFATAEQTRGLPATVVSLYNKVLSGKRLNAQQVQQFKSQSRSLFGAADKRFKALSNRYKTLSERLGLSPENVVTDFGATTRAPAPGGAPSVPGTVVTPPQNQSDPLGIR